MSEQPNIIFIMTDQQRHDTLRATGNGEMITPSLDRLADQGVAFTHAFSCGAACVASRAALFTGMYAHNTGVYGNQYPWGDLRTWLHDFREHGYHVANVGKMHQGKAPGAFHERFIVENKSSRLSYDEWNRYLWLEGMDIPERHKTIPDWRKELNSDVWSIAEKYHSDVFVGNAAVNFIDRWDNRAPLFLQIGFPGPHEPYDPPSRFLKMYADAPLKEPVGGQGELSHKPSYQAALRDHFASNHHEHQIDMAGASNHAIERMRRHYCAVVSTIDEKIGEIMDALERNGMLSNSIIVFTSDHGDHLGDHGLPYKWTMYDSIVRVPLIISAPGTLHRGRIDDRLFSHIDVGPSLLGLAGISIPSYLDGIDRTTRVLGDGQSDASLFVVAEENFATMLRTETHKLVNCTDERHAELYDLENDPEELINEYENPEYGSIKSALQNRLLHLLAESCHRSSDYRCEPATVSKVRSDRMM
jgi:arylsulfatase